MRYFDVGGVDVSRALRRAQLVTITLHWKCIGIQHTNRALLHRDITSNEASLTDAFIIAGPQSEVGATATVPSEH